MVPAIKVTIEVTPSFEEMEEAMRKNVKAAVKEAAQKAKAEWKSQAEGAIKTTHAKDDYIRALYMRSTGEFSAELGMQTGKSVQGGYTGGKFYPLGLETGLASAVDIGTAILRRVNDSKTFVPFRATASKPKGGAMLSAATRKPNSWMVTPDKYKGRHLRLKVVEALEKEIIPRTFANLYSKVTIE